MSFRFEFNELRAAQAAAFLVRQPGVDMSNYTKLIKLLYLADRESLVRTGSTITGAAFCCMENGPVLSQVYDCVKYPLRFPIWNKYLPRSGQFDVKLTEDPGDGELSDFDLETLRALARKHASLHYGKMIDFVHGLPEWKNPGERTCLPLDPAEVLRAEHVDAETISEFECENKYQVGVQHMFGQ